MATVKLKYKECFQSNRFSSEWRVDSLQLSYQQCLSVSNLIGSPASGETGVAQLLATRVG